MADSELADLRKQCITSLYLCTDNVSKYLDEEKDSEFAKLRSYVTDYCLLEAQQKVSFDALEKAKRETDSTNLDSMQDRFTSHLASLAGKRLHVDQHPFMTEFNKRIAKGQQRATENADESDIAITETQDQYIDPITKKAIVDPVKNSVCNHIYEKAAILEMISLKNRTNNRTRCPVAGCGNKGPILKEHLVSDEELRFRMTLTQHSTMIQERSIMDLDNSME